MLCRGCRRGSIRGWWRCVRCLRLRWCVRSIRCLVVAEVVLWRSIGLGLRLWVGVILRLRFWVGLWVVRVSRIRRLWVIGLGLWVVRLRLWWVGRFLWVVGLRLWVVLRLWVRLWLWVCRVRLGMRLWLRWRRVVRLHRLRFRIGSILWLWEGLGVGRVGRLGRVVRRRVRRLWERFWDWFSHRFNRGRWWLMRIHRWCVRWWSGWCIVLRRRTVGVSISCHGLVHTGVRLELVHGDSVLHAIHRLGIC